MLENAKQWLVNRWLETKAVVLPDEWYRREGFYRIASLRGIDHLGIPEVTDEIALQISAFYCCAKVLAEDHAVQPCFLYQREPDSDKIRKATEHRLYRLLHDAPNDEHAANSFFETITAHAAVCGTGYARIARSRSSKEVIALYPIMPNEIQRDRDGDGRLIFRVMDRGQWEQVPRSEIFDLPGFSWTGDGGDRVAQYARLTLGLAISQEMYASNFFSRDATPGVVIERPREAPVMTDAAVKAAKEAWRNMVKSHDVAILQEGAQAKIISKSNTESQLLEQRIQQIRATAMHFRMPAYKLGDMDRMTWGNVDQMRVEYTANVLKPWNRRWRGAIYRCLLNEDEKLAGFYGEHMIESFQQGDFATQSKSFREMLASGVFSINEVRGWFNMNPVEGGEARFIQLNMQTVVDAATGANLQGDSGRVPVQP